MTDQPTTTREAGVEELRAELARLQKHHDDFRTRARDRAIQGFHDGQWSVEALNDTLTDLGLEPHEPQLISRYDLNMSFQIEARTGDEQDDRELVDRLRGTEIIQAMQAALAAAIGAHLPDRPLSVTDRPVETYLGYGSVVRI